ncbi:D-galactonate dehydratase [Bacillus smithii 7_3_47FAA]|uniref:D-galactonate dehydratase n=1 Tax=Bacillus smithii 7_3_47FAA TaxID=665952 RepID=G9QKS0_9BACI|nr:D-galactonate dehydratase [Bacillus smithii 7_3_47FAA]
MKITRYKLFQVPPRWLFLKIETDEGITGWGEPIIEGRAETVKTAVKELMEYLIGKDPSRIEDHWNMLYRSGFYRGGPILMSAIAGIDQALWDIKGKYFNAPIHELMGGACRDSIRVYSWIGGDRPSDVGKAAKSVVEAGFTAVKMNATEELQYIDSYEKIDQVIERISAVRESVGPYIGIGIDFHGRVHKPMAKILAKELEPFKPMFIEEPVLPQNNEALREIANHTTIPIARRKNVFKMGL